VSTDSGAVVTASSDGLSTRRDAGPVSEARARVQVTLSPQNMWRVGLALLAVVAVGLLVKFVVSDGGSVIFAVIMSWFAAIAIAPVVNRLSRHMKRGAAVGLVFAAFALFAVVFVAAFGDLFVREIEQLIRQLPSLVDGALKWINSTFNSHLSRDSVLSSVHLSPQKIAASAGNVGVSLLGFVGSAAGAAFSLFTFGMFLFYLSADMPRLERWIGSLFPPRHQEAAETVWKLTMEKTGGYVGSRLVLAGINAGTTAIVFVIIGMPYWLALALWTGIVAQFVPTIGTYISIALPVIVGLLTPTPWIGWVALGWALLYQQVENVTIEPKISSKAVDVNPAVSFGAVLLGAALFGVAGAVLAVPVIAMLLALLEIYGNRYDLLPELAKEIDSTETPRSRKGRRATADTAAGTVTENVDDGQPAAVAVSGSVSPAD